MSNKIAVKRMKYSILTLIAPGPPLPSEHEEEVSSKDSPAKNACNSSKGSVISFSSRCPSSDNKQLSSLPPPLLLLMDRIIDMSDITDDNAGLVEKGVTRGAGGVAVEGGGSGRRRHKAFTWYIKGGVGMSVCAEEAPGARGHTDSKSM